jgi:hypothetical protein
MARIRTIKPEFFESQRLGSLSVLARLTFTGLISLADDEGRGRGGVVFLRGRIHPYAKDVPGEALELSMEELEDAGLVTFYQVAACDYYQLPGWHEHQRIEKPRPSALPAPDGWKPPRPIDDSSPTPPRRVAVGMEGNGKEGNGERPSLTQLASGFDLFWAAYPRKVSKPVALKAWLKVSPPPELVAMILVALGVHTRSEQWTKDGGQFIPHPATWLNQQRWEDEIKTARRVAVGAAPVPGKYDHLEK